MFFTLPLELRSQIWAKARFFTALTKVNEHLSSRPRCINGRITSTLEVHLCVGDHKRITLHKFLGSRFIFEQCCTITHDVFPVKVVYHVGDRIYLDLYYFRTTSRDYALEYDAVTYN